MFVLCGQTVFSQCALVCQNSITVAIGASGTATLTPPVLLNSSVGCSNDFSINVSDASGNVYGPVLGDSLLGMPLTATLLHQPSGNSCNTQVTLVDQLPPTLDCGGDTLFVWCNFPFDSLEWPTVADNVTDSADIEVDFTDVFTDLECFDSVGNVPVTAYLLRTWTAVDESGNEASCTQHIFVKRATLDMVVFPKHRDGTAAPALECSVQDPNDLAITGEPTVEGLLLDNETNCELVVSFNDQQVPICGGARKIIRTWSVFDLCTEDFRVYAQIIRVLDTTPPAVTCPASVTVTTFSSACSAQVYLPQATATDACSGATVTPAWQFGTGTGPFNTVPVGTYTVNYTAKDGCNNTATCQITVTVKDDKKPTALCEGQIEVHLEDDGTAIIFSETFDNGSYDNCGIAALEVSRNGEPFDEFVAFDCSDIGQPVQVTLQVVDQGGLSSSCTASAVVKDLIKPEILCPAAASVNCGANYNNPSLTGQPYATDNCTVGTPTYTNIVNLNSCGNGTVVRNWVATDQSGNTATCQQTITVGDFTPISVTFPGDILTYECEPDTDPAVTGEPVVTGKDCEQLQITHTDYYFYTAAPACYKLIRNWAIIDWCSYQPNDPNSVGFWDHTQVIEVRDSTPPVMECPANLTVGIENTGCQTFAEIPLPGMDDCSDQLTVTNNSPFAQSANGAASGIYPKGTHTVTYTVADGCGNTSQCSIQVNVVDAQAPSPICNNGISVTIQQNGFVTVMPSMINNGSFDNCSPTSSLILQVSPNTFNCQSLGSKTVTLTVTDQAGNSAFCQTTVVVQDNFNVCNNQTTAVIAGKLTRDNGDPLAQKLVGLSGGISMAVTSDVDGTFDFPNLPLGQDYTLTPSYNTKPLNGVTTYDIVLVRRHILGIDYLDSPYKLIAADVNRSGSVTTFDLVDMQKLILNITTAFPNNNPSWRFVPASHVFANPANPFAQPIPESLTLENVAFSQFDVDFVGIKVGDVNDTANPATFGEGAGDERELEQDLLFSTEDMELVAGHEYAIPFMVRTGDAQGESVAGFQFTVGFDENNLELLAVEPGNDGPLKPSNFGLPANVGAGALTVAWVNTNDQALPSKDGLFTVRFRAKNSAWLSNSLTINSKYTPAAAYIGDASAPSANFEVRGVALEFTEPLPTELAFFPNRPNPFLDRTTVGFHLPKAANATLRVFDQYGRLLQTHEAAFPAGRSEVLLDLAGQGAGLMICTLDVAGFQTKTIKMMCGN